LIHGGSFAGPIVSLPESTVPRKIGKDTTLSAVFAGRLDYRGKLIPLANCKRV